MKNTRLTPERRGRRRDKRGKGGKEKDKRGQEGEEGVRGGTVKHSTTCIKISKKFLVKQALCTSTHVHVYIGYMYSVYYLWSKTLPNSNNLLSIFSSGSTP